MKPLFIIIIGLSLACTQLHAQTSVVANITNLKSNDGVCRACLLIKDENIACGGKNFVCAEAEVKNKTARVEFANVQPGYYAVFVFHDANNNRVMDKTFLGVPKEGYGASNNKLPYTSAPRFEDNKFQVVNGAPVHLHIQLRNVL